MSWRWVSIAFAAVIVVACGAQWTSAAEDNLRAGLAHLRSGDQVRAEQEFTRYRHTEPDPGVRSSIDRMLPLLRRPLPDDVREYLARTVEDAVALRAARHGPAARPSYLSRLFPVFP
jgi:hypothetical protein